MLDRDYNPGQLQIQREISNGTHTTVADFDNIDNGQLHRLARCMLTNDIAIFNGWLTTGDQRRLGRRATHVKANTLFKTQMNGQASSANHARDRA